MSMTIQQLELLPLLYTGQHTRIYYQETSDYGGPVLIKALWTEQPTPKQSARFSNEYMLTRDLAVAGVRKALDSMTIGRRHVVVLQYVQGQTLREAFVRRRRSLTEMLRMAAEAARVLSAIHEHRIIHKDVNCRNILIASDSGQPTFIDFGIASAIALKTHHLGNPDTLEGTLAYISPEQTGRTNSVVDERTDLYSFGVVLYEVLTGRLPFEAADALELVHCHIARRPEAVYGVEPGMPRIVSDIVMKLLEKNADDRYQSAHGLAVDLERCLELAEKDPAGFQSLPDMPFELAQDDLSGRFQTPQKLYGRQQQRQTLLEVFERVATQGRPELLMVAGYSGVGKSALVQEVHRPMTEKRGMFLDGKFDQYQKNVPYYALIQAFDTFVDLLLTEPEETLNAWKTAILEAVSPNGKVLLDLIPRLAFVIGEQPPVPEIGPQEARNRFAATVQNFLRAICRREHPLILFLDDLQWADSASRNLVQDALRDRELRYLLVIAAYRDNEVDADHPWMVTVNALEKAQVPAQTIQLTNLSSDDINALLADTVSATLEETAPLAALLVEKTGGNAFFTHQFLQALHDDGLLRFDGATRRWVWDAEQIQRRAASENVVALMERKMRALPAETQTVMTVAACIGNSFDLTLLAQACQLPQSETLDRLWPAVENKLILPLDDRYKYIHLQVHAEREFETAATSASKERAHFAFIHDRVQQGAYTLPNAAEREALHLRIGRLLLAQTSDDELEERLFEIALQFNAGHALLESPEERLRLAEFNLRAGRKAMASSAYEAAIDFLEPAAAQVAESGWSANADLTTDIEASLVEAEYMTARYDAARRRIQRVLPHLNDLTARGRFYVYRLHLYGHEQAYEEGIAALVEMLQEYGVLLPRKVTTAHVLLALFRIKRLVKQQQPLSRLRDLPQVTDPGILCIFELLQIGIYLTALSTSPMLLPLSHAVLRLTFRHGMTKASAGVFGFCGFLISSAFNAFDDAYMLGKVGMELYYRFRHADSFIMLFSQMTQWLKKPPAVCLEEIRRAQTLSRDIGNLRSECIGDEMYYQFLTYFGLSLAEADKRAEPALRRLQRLNQADLEEWTAIYLQQNRCLLGRSEDLFTMQGPDFNGDTLLRKWRQQGSASHIAIYRLSQMMLLTLGEEHGRSVELARSIGKVMRTTFKGWLGERHYRLWYSLSLCQLARAESSRWKRWKWLRQVAKNQKRLKVFAEYCPMNFQNVYDLVEAERQDLTGRRSDAVRLYERAIVHAREQGFVMEEALANEYAAQFYLRQGNETVAALYMRRARDRYADWGSPPKTALLEARYSVLLAQDERPIGGLPNDVPVTTAVTMTTNAASTQLDVETIVKASQTLAREMEVKQVLHGLLRLVVENAGAQQACLLLKEGKAWQIQGQVEPHGAIEVLQGTPFAAGASDEAVSALPAAIVEYVLRTGESVVLADAAQDERFGRDTYVQHTQLKSALCLPIIHKGETTGILYLENNLIPGAFTPQRQELLHVLCSQAAISLENARLLENMRVQERLQREMELARRIQTAILPRDMMHPDFDIAATMLPAEEVGGDYYDVLTGKDGALWLAIGDVSGHGVTPGLVMMMAQTIHAALAAHLDVEPRTMVNMLNRSLYANVSERLEASHFMTFTTLKYGGGGCFEGAGAHLDLIVHRAVDNTCELIDTPGCYLNFIADISHATESFTFTLEIGDTLVLYTDGLTEAYPPGGEILDRERFTEIVRRHAQKAPAEMRDAILQDVLTWCRHSRADDMTLLVARRKA